jgi:hypothetical protein
VTRFGVPSSLTSDRGTQFSSEVWANMCTTLGIHHKMTTAYHPQANGLVERFHRQLKSSLRARLCGVDWASHLPWVLLGLRTAPKEDTALSSAEMVYGCPLTLPGQFLEGKEPPTQPFVHGLQQAVHGLTIPTRPLPEERTVSTLPAGLLEATYVYVRQDGNRPPLAQLYEGPYAVISRGAKSFKLQVGQRESTVSIDRLKPHLGTEDVRPAVPARRGRPPTSGTPVVASLAPSAPGDGWNLVTTQRRKGACTLVLRGLRG